jgi:hypothetical protein
MASKPVHTDRQADSVTDLIMNEKLWEIFSVIKTVSEEKL